MERESKLAVDLNWNLKIAIQFFISDIANNYFLKANLTTKYLKKRLKSNVVWRPWFLIDFLDNSFVTVSLVCWPAAAEASLVAVETATEYQVEKQRENVTSCVHV